MNSLVTKETQETDLSASATTKGTAQMLRHDMEMKILSPRQCKNYLCVTISPKGEYRAPLRSAF